MGLEATAHILCKQFNIDNSKDLSREYLVGFTQEDLEDNEKPTFPSSLFSPSSDNISSSSTFSGQKASSSVPDMDLAALKIPMANVISARQVELVSGIRWKARKRERRLRAPEKADFRQARMDLVKTSLHLSQGIEEIGQAQMIRRQVRGPLRKFENAPPAQKDNHCVDTQTSRAWAAMAADEHKRIKDNTSALATVDGKSVKVYGAVECVNPSCDSFKAGYSKRARDSNASVSIALSRFCQLSKNLATPGRQITTNQLEFWSHSRSDDFHRKLKRTAACSD
ncbi:hypothetical protein KI688_004357 [Linnemannia hyalina]|uniref:Uncharacterized protein n=1 Tax=Linnemannia hyalina TaxID=64524 RepID=A0A9P8BPS9_9FUNG|nr:hypothetical protein KI688_004357 [Linnemannia hyalina]